MKYWNRRLQRNEFHHEVRYLSDYSTHEAQGYLQEEERRHTHNRSRKSNAELVYPTHTPLPYIDMKEFEEKEDFLTNPLDDNPFLDVSKTYQDNLKPLDVEGAVQGPNIFFNNKEDDPIF